LTILNRNIISSDDRRKARRRFCHSLSQDPQQCSAVPKWPHCSYGTKRSLPNSGLRSLRSGRIASPANRGGKVKCTNCGQRSAPCKLRCRRKASQPGMTIGKHQPICR
jgi:hypothetical protein